MAGLRGDTPVMTLGKRDILPVAVLLLLRSLAFAHLMALPGWLCFWQPSPSFRSGLYS
jgi:hypothetical protein